MSQVGHADSKMTLDVYAQLEQPVQRAHGTAFDELLRTAKRQLEDAEWVMIGSRGASGADSSAKSEAETRRGCSTNDATELNSAMARPGLEPGTPRFSVVCSTN